MDNFPNKKDRILVLMLWMIFFVTAVSFSLFLLAFQDIGTILTFVISTVITIYLSTLIKKVSQGYFLKYYYNKKELNKLYKESVKKFNGADEEFIKDFKKRISFQYYTTGLLYPNFTIEDDKWLLSDKDNITGFIMLINLLDNAVKNKLGLNKFIDDAYNLTHNGELIIRTLENEFLTGELRYLLFRTYLLTDFNLSDNKLSEEYSLKISNIRKEVDERYTPLLYNFEEEIMNIQYKMELYIKDNKDIK